MLIGRKNDLAFEGTQSILWMGRADIIIASLSLTLASENSLRQRGMRASQGEHGWMITRILVIMPLPMILERELQKVRSERPEVTLVDRRPHWPQRRYSEPLG